jgi:hypothetical protein
MGPAAAHVATRDAKLAANFLSTVALANCPRVLAVNESEPYRCHSITNRTFTVLAQYIVEGFGH